MARRAGRQEGRYLAAGTEREAFDELAKQRADWLSPLDRASWRRQTAPMSANARRSASGKPFVSPDATSVAFTALANIEADKRPVNAAKFALAAWPRDENDTMTPKLAETLDALAGIVPNFANDACREDTGEQSRPPPSARTASASSPPPVTGPRASGTRDGRVTRRSSGTRDLLVPPRSARTASASSPPPMTGPRASGTSRPA